MKERNFEQFKRIYKFIEVLITVSIITSVFTYIWYQYFNPMMAENFTGKGNLLIIFVYFVCFLLFNKVFGGFEVGFYRVVNAILSQHLAVICTNIVMSVQIILMVGSLYEIKNVLILSSVITIIQIILATISVLIFNGIHSKLFPAWKMLLIYEEDSVDEFLWKIEKRKDKYIIKEKIKANEGIEAIKKKLEEYTVVLIYNVSAEIRNDIMKHCYGEEIRVYQTSKISDVLIRSAQDHHLFDTPLLLSRNSGLSFEQKFLKRIVDIIFSLIILIITSPIMLITLIGIKIHDGGSIFFIQERVTNNYKKFMIYKFRSMIENAEIDGKPQPATTDDDRITPIGKFIRKTRIDELPQLINVLKGDMSLVGPRPERVEHVEKYTKDMPEFKYRLKVRGGLTGYAQVYGKYNTSPYDKLKLDLMYIENYSLLTDFKIMIMTIKTIFVKTSTEGFGKTP